MGTLAATFSHWERSLGVWGQGAISMLSILSSVSPQSGEAVQSLGHCLDTGETDEENKLSLNLGKTETLWVSASCVREIVPLPILDVFALIVEEQVHNLGMLPHPALEAQVALVSGSGFFTNSGWFNSYVHSWIGKALP